MNRLISILFMGAATLLSQSAMAQVYVDGYLRSDGAYVAPHWRSAPDSTPSNNWSVSPNVNPFTGSPGALAPAFGPPATPGWPTIPGAPSPPWPGDDCDTSVFC